MAVRNIWHDSQKRSSDFTGLDTDAKPTSSQGLVPYVSRFFETEVATNCSTVYLWTSTGWVLQGFTPEEVEILRTIARREPPPMP